MALKLPIGKLSGKTLVITGGVAAVLLITIVASIFLLFPGENKEEELRKHFDSMLGDISGQNLSALGDTISRLHREKDFL